MDVSIQILQCMLMFVHLKLWVAQVSKNLNSRHSALRVKVFVAYLAKLYARIISGGRGKRGGRACFRLVSITPLIFRMMIFHLINFMDAYASSFHMLSE